MSVRESSSVAGLDRDRSLEQVIEDHALSRVPADERKSGWALSWMSTGIVTTLLGLLTGALVTDIAGVALGIVAGVVTAIWGAGLGWAMGHVSFREGVSSTVTGRFYGFGLRGSAIGAAIFAFTIIGLFAIENALLYHGTLFLFGWHDTWPARIGIYGVLTVGWILLTAFGVNAAMRTSSVLVIAFLALLGFMIYKAGWDSGTPIGRTLGHGALVPGSGGSHFETALSLLAGTAGALALVDADYGRYARSSRDVGILAVNGSLIIDVFNVVAGAIVIYGGTGLVVRYLIDHHQATAATAGTAAAGIGASNTGAFFIVLSTVLGFILMYAAQAKAQVLNTYSGSLSLTNLCDALVGWRPGRLAMVVASSLIGMVFVAAGILSQIQSYFTWLGVLTTTFCAVVIVDFFLVRRGRVADRDRIEEINWAGVVTAVVACAVGIVLQQTHVFSLGFIVAAAITVVLYPLLRTSVLTPGTGTRWVSAREALLDE